jgi:hypothetical protein
MSRPYRHYNPNQKQAFTVEDGLKALNPTDNQLANYGIYGGAGALGGAGIGALIELLRNKEDKDYLKAMLLGGGIGGGLGVGAKALGDLNLEDEKNIIAKLIERKNKIVKSQEDFRKWSPLTTGDGIFSRERNPTLNKAVDAGKRISGTAVGDLQAWHDDTASDIDAHYKTTIDRYIARQQEYQNKSLLKGLMTTHEYGLLPWDPFRPWKS